ncbi:MMPL family transporter [Paenibacillus ginsengarvi]|nr:MMPL family transporter [Paenibacillus ginsengarvi]
MSKHPLQKLARAVSSRKGAITVIVVWLLAIVLLSGIAPGSKPYATSSGEGSIHEDTPSAIAQQIMNEQFPSKDGLTALLVFHTTDSFTAQNRTVVSDISQWLASDRKPEHVASVLPFHQLPKQVQDQMISSDGTTLIINAALDKNLPSDQVYDTLKQIRDYADEHSGGRVQLEITGPAGIAADTITLFKNADFVLMFATIGLILVILIVIYRSPLLAVIPLLISGIVYQATDRFLGLAAKNGWFVVDKQALSIMMILLFAVLTDYCLFVLARFREELKKNGSKYDAMRAALSQVAEPILFSGGTVLVAMLTLFATVFKPYHHFAPVFSVAMVVILLGGLTLIPALFALLGRNVFWPFVPKLLDEAVKPTGMWTRIGSFVSRKPGVPATALLLLLVLGSLNVFSMNYSYNLMKSFPEDISSRRGFELLEQSFPPGQLAPVSVILQSNKDINLDAAFTEKLVRLTDLLKQEEGVQSVSPAVTSQLTGSNAVVPRNFLAESKRAIKLQITLQNNPYDASSLDAVSQWRENSEKLLREAGFDPGAITLHYAGQTADQVDVRAMNQRDTIVSFTLISLFIGVMLAFQARSVVIAFTMLTTMLLSYTATLGIGWLLFHYVLGFESISYRMPVYSFVFLIALGVDYNIMLVSRIREEARKREWKEAVSRGVAMTGGVISSAGIILAATFCVLITQPLQELYLFGAIMAIGILMDTFLVRGMLLPALLIWIGRRGSDRSVGPFSGVAGNETLSAGSSKPNA